MKLPNGYGSVIKLGGKRRNPYAVRITVYVKDEDTGHTKQKFKYLAYFSKPDLAYAYLADYNKGIVVDEHIKFTESPTFAEIYDKWKTYRKSLKNQISDASWKNYNIAFNHFEDLHDRKIVSIRQDDIQNCLNKYNNKSKSCISCMRALIKALYKYSVNNGYTDKDLTEGLLYEWITSTEQIHSRYTNDEIETL